MLRKGHILTNDEKLYGCGCREAWRQKNTRSHGHKKWRCETSFANRKTYFCYFMISCLFFPFSPNASYHVIIIWHASHWKGLRNLYPFRDALLDLFVENSEGPTLCLLWCKPTTLCNRIYAQDEWGWSSYSLLHNQNIRIDAGLFLTSLSPGAARYYCTSIRSCLSLQVDIFLRVFFPCMMTEWKALRTQTFSLSNFNNSPDILRRMAALGYRHFTFHNKLVSLVFAFVFCWLILRWLNTQNKDVLHC